MIYTTETLQLEEKVEDLLKAFYQSELSETYRGAKKELLESPELAEKKATFLKAKEAYDKIADYGSHAPGYKETYRALRKAKRSVDLVPEMENYKLAETNVQDALDQVAYRICKFVAEDIKVDYGNPFFHKETSHHSCHGGGCASHGK